MVKNIRPISQETDEGFSRFLRLSATKLDGNVENVVANLDYDTILVVGSGAIENGWRPISNLCSEIIGNKFAGLVSYGKNNEFFYNEPFDHMLTAIAFTETATRSRFSRSLEWAGFSTSDSLKMFGNAISTRERMGDLFAKDSTLKLRQFDHKRFNIDYRKTLVVTSNWDNCVWSNVNFENVIYLHGHSEIKNSIVLPTQFVTDEHSLKGWIDARVQLPGSAVVKKNVDAIKGFLKAIPDYLRNGKLDVQLELNYVHDLFREAIWSKKLKRVFVWGYGFNLYDAEINLMLTLASQSNHPKVEILNPDPSVLLKAAQVLARRINDVSFHHPMR